MHCEDDNLLALNYNHGPSPKIWTIISPQFAPRLERIMKEDFPDLFEKCSGCLQHKYFFLTREFLEKNEIPYGRIVQRENEEVFLSPHTYHFGFNAGHNIAEAVNFGTHKWLKEKKGEDLEPCNCCDETRSVVLDKKPLEGNNAFKLDLEEETVCELAKKFMLPKVPDFLLKIQDIDIKWKQNKKKKKTLENSTLTSTTIMEMDFENQSTINIENDLLAIIPENQDNGDNVLSEIDNNIPSCSNISIERKTKKKQIY